MQEQIQKLTVGKISFYGWREGVFCYLNCSYIPRSMLVLLLDELVDTCKPGDDVTVM